MEGADTKEADGLICDFFLDPMIHPRIFAKRRDAVSVAALVSVLSLCKMGLDGYNAVTDKFYFDGMRVLFVCLHMGLYVLRVRRFRY